VTQTPATQDQGKVCSVDKAIAVEVSRSSDGGWSPASQERCKIVAIHNTI
jgi:hypothetical protein